MSAVSTREELIAKVRSKGQAYDALPPSLRAAQDAQDEQNGGDWSDTWEMKAQGAHPSFLASARYAELKEHGYTPLRAAMQAQDDFPIKVVNPERGDLGPLLSDTSDPATTAARSDALTALTLLELSPKDLDDEGMLRGVIAVYPNLSEAACEALIVEHTSRIRAPWYIRWSKWATDMMRFGAFKRLSPLANARAPQ